MTPYGNTVTDTQLAAQERAAATPLRPGHPYRAAHWDGRITDHRTFAAAERSWKFGDVLYQWHRGRWAIWTSAGLF